MDSFEEIARTFLEAVTSDLDTYSSMKGEIVKNSDTSFSLRPTVEGQERIHLYQQC